MSVVKRTVVMIGCGKSKKKLSSSNETVRARDLYTSDLFKKRVAYAEKFADEWFILSANHRLIRPNSACRSYNVSISDLTKIERSVWATDVANAVIVMMDSDDLSPPEIAFEIHAGKDYAEDVSQILKIFGFVVTLPCKGLGIGQQLAFYKERLSSSKQAVPS